MRVRRHATVATARPYSLPCMKKIVAVAPATSALSMEVVVRVDDGREIILRDGGMQRFVAGDRVRLRSSSHGLRVERR